MKVQFCILLNNWITLTSAGANCRPKRFDHFREPRIVSSFATRIHTPIIQMDSRLVDEIETKFQRLHPCFRGPATQWKYYECCLTKPEVGNPTIKPPSWISDFRFMSHSIQTTSIDFLDPKNMGLAFGISFLAIYKLRSKYFRFRGRHLGLPTSGLVGQHSDYLHWLAGPQKYGVSLWNFVPILSTSWGPRGLQPPLPVCTSLKKLSKARDNLPLRKSLWFFINPMTSVDTGIALCRRHLTWEN